MPWGTSDQFLRVSKPEQWERQSKWGIHKSTEINILYVNNCPTRYDYIQFYYIFCRQLYMFRNDTLIHHQEHIQTVIKTSSTGRTVFATVRWCGGVGTTPPRQRTVTNTVRQVPDVITFWMCSWLWMRVSSETRRKYNKSVYSRILLFNYWHPAQVVYHIRPQLLPSTSSSIIPQPSNNSGLYHKIMYKNKYAKNDER